MISYYFYHFYKHNNLFEHFGTLSRQIYQLKIDSSSFVYEYSDTITIKDSDSTTSYQKIRKQLIEDSDRLNKYISQPNDELSPALLINLKMINNHVIHMIKITENKATINSGFPQYKYATEFQRDHLNPLNLLIDQTLKLVDQKLSINQTTKHSLIAQLLAIFAIHIIMLFLFINFIKIFIQKHISTPIENIVNTSKEIQEKGYISTQYDPDTHYIREFSNLQYEVNRIAIAISQHEQMRVQNLLNAERVNMIPVAAHNIINPLNSIKALCEHQIDTCEMDQAAKQYSTDVINNVFMLTSWVKVLLYYYSDGKINASFNQLSSVLNNALQSTLYLVGKKKVSIDMDNIPNQLSFYFDKTLIEQAITCVLINALEAVRREVGVIKIKFEEHDDSASITIVDNGIGLTDSFFNSTAATTTKSKGHGIGVAFVKKVALLHPNLTVVWANNTFLPGANVVITFNKFNKL